MKNEIEINQNYNQLRNDNYFNNKFINYDDNYNRPFSNVNNYNYNDNNFKLNNNYQFYSQKQQFYNNNRKSNNIKLRTYIYLN